MSILRTAALALGFIFLISTAAEAAFIVEPNGKAFGNFFAPGGFSNSTTVADVNGNLPALGLTQGAPSIFGGSEYQFSYTPGVDGDNTLFSAGDRTNQFAQFVSSGLPAAGATRFRVFRVHPEMNSVTGGPTNFEVLVNGVTQITDSIDPNLDINNQAAVDAALATGSNIGLWELLGEVTISDPNDVIDVIQTPTTQTFVSMRSGGVLFEAIPEPTTAAMLALSAMTLAATKRYGR